MGTADTAPPLTVWLGGAVYTFLPGQDVSIGRSAQCDICLDSPEFASGISRVHAVLRVDGSGWTVVDHSRNGIFLDGTRVSTSAIGDGQSLTIGSPTGPQLTFRITSGERPRTAPPRSAPPTPPQTPPQTPPPARSSVPPAPPQAPPARPTAPPAPPVAPQTPPAPGPGAGPTQVLPRNPVPPQAPRNHPQPPPPPRVPPAPAPAPSQHHPPSQPIPAVPATGNEGRWMERTVIGRIRPELLTPPPAGGATAVVANAVGRIGQGPRLAQAPTGSTTVGRVDTNAVVVDDALVSRVHAILTPTAQGLQIQDNRSSNGTFVNGQRIDQAVLHDGDIVTVGNTDLVASGTTLLPRPASAREGGLQVYGLNLTIDGRSLMNDMSFNAAPGTLTAVIGPSGCGKSTLSKLVGGAMTPTGGLVAFDGHDVHTEYMSMRSRIGMVPQDDVVHRQLTVEQALGYAAELRLPSDTTKADRDAVVARVLDELELTQHQDKRIDKLSGGQRKRVSVAMELLTGPSLLILDEPTSGLDPALDRQVMSMLRSLADAGRVVLVVTHSLTYLNMCDQVLLLAPGGMAAFTGPPAQIGAAMGSEDWADIFARVSTAPEEVHREYLAHHPSPPAPQTLASDQSSSIPPPRTSLVRQFSAIMRRQVRLIAADRGYFVFLALLPFVLGLLSLVVPGHAGLGHAKPDAAAEPVQILVLLNIAAVFLGTALTIRDLVGERTIFQREQAVGLSASAYLAAKIVVYSVAAALQVAVVTAIVVLGKGAPAYGGALLGDGPVNAVAELYLTLAAAAICSAMAGLALSSLARSGEQVLPILVGMIMVSMVFAGGLVPVSGRPGLDQISYLLPARWGFAATAATVNLRTAALRSPAEDALWLHTPQAWLTDMAALLVLSVLCVAFVRWRLRLAAAGQTPSAKATDSRLGRWMLIATAVMAVAATAVVVAVQYHPTNTANGDDELITTRDDLDTVLPAPDVVAPMVQATALVSDTVLSPVKGQNYVPRNCAGAMSAGPGVVYNSLDLRGMAARRLHESTEPAAHYVLQVVTALPSAKAATDFQAEQRTDWEKCSGTTVTTTGDIGVAASGVIGATTAADDTIKLSYTVPDRPDYLCQRVLKTHSNVVVDVLACGDRLADGSAAKIVDRIVENLH